MFQYQKPQPEEPAPAVDHDEDERVRAWNHMLLLGLGVSWDTADLHGGDVDPYDVKQLVENGCEPDLAVQIRLKR